MLSHCLASKIGLGTVQWGLDYGISNIDGRTPPDEVQQILRFARSTGISVIDTARDYGCAEQVLGGNDTSSFSLCTKIPSFKHLTKSSAVENYFRISFNSSLEALNKDKVEYLLLHDCDDLLSKHGHLLISLLQEYKHFGKVNKIGFSAYTSSQISSALDLFTPDIIQIPFNIFDQRLFIDSTLSHLKSLDVEVHARSVFLQGLLLMKPANLRPYFAPYLPFISNWYNKCNNSGFSPIDLCLHFVLTHPLIDKAIIGTSSVRQLREIVDSISKDPTNISSFPFSSFAHNSCELLNPALWSLDN